MLPRLLSRRLVYATVAFVSASFAAIDPSWATTLGFDVWNLPELERQEREASQLTKALTADDSEVQERIVLKERKIEELIAGHLTLAEVTDEFLAMNRNQPGYMMTIRRQYPGRTDRECVARNVIEYVRGRVDDDGSETDVLSQLDAEFDEMAAEEPAALP